MAISTGAYRTPCELRLWSRSPSLPSSWSTGYTQIGRVNSEVLLLPTKDLDLSTKPQGGSAPFHARVVGAQCIAEFVPIDWGTNTEALTFLNSSYKLGKRLTDAELFSLMVAPTAANQLHLLLPRCFCLSNGPYTFHPRRMMLEQTKLTVVALYDPELGGTHFHGEIANFPTYASPTPFIAGPLQFMATSPMPDALSGEVYASFLRVIGGSGTYEWTVVDGDIPPDMVLNANTGLLSGTPETEEETTQYTFELRVTDTVTGLYVGGSFQITVVVD